MLFDNPTSGVLEAGDLCFNIKRDEYAEYYKHIVDRIALSWYILYAWNYGERRKPEPFGVKVTFRIGARGRISGTKIVDDGGVFFVATKVAACIANASPLDAFPEHITEDSLNVRFTFLF